MEVETPAFAYPKDAQNLFIRLFMKALQEEYRYQNKDTNLGTDRYTSKTN
jgi:hypothetical protein